VREGAPEIEFSVSFGRLSRVYTVAETAELTNLSIWTIRQEIKSGRLRARRIGRCIRVLDDELDRWLHDYGSGGETSEPPEGAHEEPWRG
jgi:excisionase family DNA binding protein